MKRVAVTGLGVISPVGNDVPTFWNALCSGTCGIGPITKFDATDYPVKLAAEVHDFDPKQYMEKLDILHSDVYTHFAMAAACQAVADSGIAGTLDAERVGVYIGSGIGGIATFMTEHSKLLNRGPRRVSPYFIPMMIPNMASSMIAMRYHFHGPAMPMVTACASGTNAIGEALRLIRHGYADAMVAGGAEATVNALAAAGFSNMQALSPSEDPNAASLPFDVRRAGFVMGEGAGVLVLEELEHAKQRGATIYAELDWLRLHLRRLPHYLPRSQRGGERPRHRGCLARDRTRYRPRLLQRPRHRHAHERPHRDARDQKSARRRPRAQDQHQLHQVHDRPHARRGGRSRGRRLRAGPAGRHCAPDDQPDAAGPRL